MSFTPKANVEAAISGILTIAVVGLIGFGSQVDPSSTPIVPARNPSAVVESVERSGAVLTLPAVETVRAPGFQTAKPRYELVTAWYKNKHWWKRNAPIVGGAAGGALIGGLAGGGKGALIGGAVGGGGGYLYKRLKHSNHHQR